MERMNTKIYTYYSERIDTRIYTYYIMIIKGETRRKINMSSRYVYPAVFTPEDNGGIPFCFLI